jgi:hypothetical protein
MAYTIQRYDQDVPTRDAIVHSSDAILNATIVMNELPVQLFRNLPQLRYNLISTANISHDRSVEVRQVSTFAGGTVLTTDRIGLLPEDFYLVAMPLNLALERCALGLP